MSTTTEMQLDQLRSENERMLAKLQRMHAAVRTLPVHTIDDQRYVHELDMLRAIDDGEETSTAARYLGGDGD